MCDTPKDTAAAKNDGGLQKKKKAASKAALGTLVNPQVSPNLLGRRLRLGERSSRLRRWSARLRCGSRGLGRARSRCGHSGLRVVGVDYALGDIDGRPRP